MSKKGIVALVSIVGVAIGAFVGCSSAVTDTSTDAGTTPAPDSGNIIADSGNKTDAGAKEGGSGGACYDEGNAIKLVDATGKAGQNVCTAKQVTDYNTACLSDKATDATCKTYSDDAANAGCLGCIEGYYPDGGLSTAYPVLLPDNGTPESVYANTMTCGYLLIKKPECVKKAVDYFVCAVSACALCSESDFDACIDEADKGICKDTVEDKACTDAYDAAQTQIDAVCGTGTFDAEYAATANYLCGPPRDGG